MDLSTSITGTNNKHHMGHHAKTKNNTNVPKQCEYHGEIIRKWCEHHGKPCKGHQNTRQNHQKYGATKTMRIPGANHANTHPKTFPTHAKLHKAMRQPGNLHAHPMLTLWPKLFQTPCESHTHVTKSMQNLSWDDLGWIWIRHHLVKSRFAIQ